jgi:3-deoxy-D-manno-octulosonic-acid transferase
VRRFAYTLALYTLLPGALGHLALRARREPAYLRHVPERFGYYRQQRPAEPTIWLHAVSVGETHAAVPLIRTLQESHPDHRVVLTHTTPTGRAAARVLFGEAVLRCYLPYDFPGAVARFLRYFRPRVGILMETEIWPNLIHACHARGVPLYLVNARLSEKSWKRYRRFRQFTHTALRELAGIAAQGPDDARRLRELGASTVGVAGNLKFDVAVPAEQVEMGRSWRAGWGTRPVLLAASTRAGEEAHLLDAMARYPIPDLLLVIVPRHPQRFHEVAALIERSGFRVRRRTAGVALDAHTQVLLGDSMGEMFAYYAACDVAFIGGSLMPLGAHNLIEACAVGKPVLLGPSTYNFEEAAAGAIAAGAALRVNDADRLMHETRRLLSDPASAERMAEAARVFSRAHQGATRRVLEMLRW